MVLYLKCVKNFYENITIVLTKKAERSHFKCRYRVQIDISRGDILIANKLHQIVIGN